MRPQKKAARRKTHEGNVLAVGDLAFIYEAVLGIGFTPAQQVELEGLIAMEVSVTPKAQRMIEVIVGLGPHESIPS